jgi:hypothetical protein
MPSREYYQRQAETLRNMARTSKDPAISARYIKRADEYQVLADTVSPGQAKDVRQRAQQQEQKVRR